MRKVELNIIALSDSKSKKGNFVLVLEEQGGFRRLAIIIGPYEAQAIAVYLERIQTNRPLTHDLLKNTLEHLGAQLKEVCISKLVGEVFHAQLIGKKVDGSELMIDARSSDAIALALRCECPIYTTEAILEEAGVVLDNPSLAFTNKRGQLVDYTLEELERLLKQVVAKEDYASASKIRDAIEQKKKMV